MLVENKQIIILNLIRLGMELDKAYLLAECSDEDIKIIEADVNFEAKMKYHIACEEKRLLKQHRTARTLAASKGNTKPIEWMLEKVNPNKYGKSDVNKNDNKVVTQIYLPNNGR